MMLMPVIQSCGHNFNQAYFIYILRVTLVPPLWEKWAISTRACSIRAGPVIWTQDMPNARRCHLAATECAWETWSAGLLPFGVWVTCVVARVACFSLACTRCGIEVNTNGAELRLTPDYFEADCPPPWPWCPPRGWPRRAEPSALRQIADPVERRLRSVTTRPVLEMRNFHHAAPWGQPVAPQGLGLNMRCPCGCGPQVSLSLRSMLASNTDKVGRVAEVGCA